MVQKLKKEQGAPFYNPLIPYEDNYNNGPFGAFTDGVKVISESKSSYELFPGIKVGFPFGIPAGPLLNGKFVQAALDKGFDIAVYKTVRSHEHPCAQFPNVLGVKVEGNLTLEQAEKGIIAKNTYGSPLSVTNSFGVPSKGPDVWVDDLAKTVKYAKSGQLVIGSFQGTKQADGQWSTYLKDFVDLAQKVKDTGVEVLEVNLSCPNEGKADLLCFDIERTAEIAKAIKAQIGDTPLIIKIAYFKDQEQLEKLITAVGDVVDGIGAINTIPAKVFGENGEQALPGNGRLVAGVCGEPIRWAGLEMVQRLSKLRKERGLKFKIFGTGGVTKPEDYKVYIKAGADAVMSATGAMWNPYLAQEIKNDQAK